MPVVMGDQCLTEGVRAIDNMGGTLRYAETRNADMLMKMFLQAQNMSGSEDINVC